jgi:phosphate/sulfate permease
LAFLAWHSLLGIPYLAFLVQLRCSAFLARHSLLGISCSAFFARHSLLGIPCSAFPALVGGLVGVSAALLGAMTICKLTTWSTRRSSITLLRVRAEFLTKPKKTAAAVFSYVKKKTAGQKKKTEPIITAAVFFILRPVA